MTALTDSPRKRVLAILLAAHERSSSYGKPAPWPRDVIVRLAATTFPEAFAAGGRTDRASLIAAVLQLEREGCARVVRHPTGPLANEPKEIRLAPEHLKIAYAAGKQLGYEPLSVGLEETGRHAGLLLREGGPEWMRDFLERLCNSLRAADTSPLGMKRERFKREWRDITSGLTAAAALARGIAPAWERIVSERLYNDSKLLGRIRSHVVAILLHADPRWEGVPVEEASDLLEAYGVRRKPGLIRCAGTGIIEVSGRSYDLQDFKPVAHLPETWAEAWVDGISKTDIRQITTIENEYPFLSYVEEAGGPQGLGARGEVAIYTAGFPTPGLLALLLLIRDRAGHIQFRHWGDADVGGLRIWWFLRSKLQRPVELFRTTGLWIQEETEKGGIPFSLSERAALAKLRRQLDATPAMTPLPPVI